MYLGMSYYEAYEVTLSIVAFMARAEGVIAVLPEDSATVTTSNMMTAFNPLEEAA